MPVTRTEGYDVTQAIAEAETFVADYPAEGSTPEARIFYHAIIGYFRELGISDDDRKQIMGLYITAEFTTWQRGWSQGWDKGLAAGKVTAAPPF